MLRGRPYQEDAVSRLSALWREGKRATLLVLPTGGGKTHIGHMIVERALARGNTDVWWFAHRRELIEQPVSRFEKSGIPCAVVMGSRRLRSGAEVRVASVQTAVRRELSPHHRRALVFIDEAHRVRSRTYQEGVLARLREAYEELFLVLLTATPYRLDGKALSDVADSLSEVSTPKELIEGGYICDPIVYGAYTPDLRGVHKEHGEYVQSELDERIDQPKLVGSIVEHYLRLGEGRPAICFARRVVDSLAVVEKLQSAGIRAAHLDADTPALERNRALARLAIGGMDSSHPEALDVLSQCALLQEGWDSESDYERVLKDKSLWLGRSYPPPYRPLCVLIDAAPTASMCAYRQREGRVTRVHRDKPWARILSHSGNWERHGFLIQHEGFELDTPLVLPGVRRNSAEGAVVGIRRCPECMAVWPAGTETCGACGASLLPPTEVLEEAPGELVEVKPDERRVFATPPAQEAYLREQYANWMRENQRRELGGRPPVRAGFPKVMFKQRFGRWPDQALLQRAEAAAKRMVEATG